MMNNHMMEEYLYTLRMNDGTLTFAQLLDYTNSSKTLKDEEFFAILGTLGQLKNKGYLTMEAGQGAAEDSMVLHLTDLGVQVADEAAELRVTKMLYEWIENDSPPRSA